MTQLTRTGIWSQDLRYGDAAEIADAAAELEELGYRALWIPDIGGDDLFPALDRLLGATKSLTVATGILNVWFHEPDQVARWWRGLNATHQERVLLGLGISHAPFIGEKWRKPVAMMSQYLDRLADQGVPLEQVCLAALGPRMTELAATRTAGVHPYLVDPSHTRAARAAIGDALLAVEQGVVVAERQQGMEIARAEVGGYAELPNYANNWRRLGYPDADIEDRSDRLIEGLVAVGGVAECNARLAEQFAAGADHVCLQAISKPGTGMPREAWRQLAPR